MSRLCLAAAAIIGAAAHGAHENDLARIRPERVRVALSASSVLTPNVTAGVLDGDFISLAIDNPAFNARGDWIGLYLSSADPTTTVPLKWTYCVPYLPGTYNTTGQATAVFQVYLVREPVVFMLFSGGTSAPVLVATSPVISFQDDAAPVHPRVLPGAAVGDYNIAWTTSTAATAPTLKWGTAAGVYPNSVAGATRTVAASDLCAAPATTVGFMDLGVTVTAALPGLASTHAGQVIHYTLTDAQGRTTPDYAFTVPPLAGDNTYPFYFAAFGDLGRGSFDDGITWKEYGQPTRSTVQWLASDVAGVSSAPPAFVHHFGDLSYATGYLQTWDEYLYLISQFTYGTVYAIGVGNHECDQPISQGSTSWSYYGNATDSGGECTVATAALLPLPGGASFSAPYYFYATGPVTVVVLSTEHDFTTGSAQLAWLESTLAAVNRTATPFIVLSVHRPMYIDSNYGATTPTGDVNVMNLLQQYVEPLTYKYQVTVILQGHNHRLERISASYQNKTVLASVPTTDGSGNVVHLFNKPAATVYYVAGTAGANYTPNDCVSVGGPCPDWSESVIYEHGYLRLTAHNDTALSMDYVATVNGTIIDRVMIIQDLAAW